MTWFQENLSQEEQRRFALILAWLGIAAAAGLVFAVLWGVIRWAID